MTKTDLTNQRQVFVEEYVRSGDHLEAVKSGNLFRIDSSGRAFRRGEFE